MSTPISNTKPLKNQISKELRAKANVFLNNKLMANNLIDIISYFEKSIKEKLSLTPAILTLEVIFMEVLKRREMFNDNTVNNEQGESSIDAANKYRTWLRDRYDETWNLLLKSIENENSSDASQALASCMKLMTGEGKYPIHSKEALQFPRQRLHSILERIIISTKSQSAVITRFKEYAEYIDVVHHCWLLIQNGLIKKSTFKNEIVALNFLEFLNIIPLTDSLEDENKLLCALSHKANGSEIVDGKRTRKAINKIWNNLMLWLDGDTPEIVHKQMLIVLLERILPHLENPILLTDFLMDSLDFGGAISLCALQGIFTLIQKHNITYPNVYEKLYSMFEPEIFHTKFKARLFYLSDIFLSSTHLPESLVAAFVKRLARLSLIAPPQDAIIILYFVGNLILRHTGLKKLMSSPQQLQVSQDPFIMEERDPSKSKALESSLWEIVLLQKHAVPLVATAAKFISHPLPQKEWDLSSVLEMKEDDIFEQEIVKKSKQYALAIEIPQTMFQPKNDQIKKHWCLL